MPDASGPFLPPRDQWFRPRQSITIVCPLGMRPWWVRLRMWWRGDA